jgi:3-keto-disaccharide hydrolase
MGTIVRNKSTVGRRWRFFPIIVVAVITGIILSLCPIFAHITTAQITGIWSDNFKGTPYAFTKDGQTSPNGKWVIVYGIPKPGAGCVQGGCMGANYGYFYEEPMTVVGPRPASHSSLAVSTRLFSDFQMTLQMNTVKQLRQGYPPYPWEVGWILFHYRDSFHHYGFNLRPNGWELMKKDNNNQCGCYVFAKYGKIPTVSFGHWQTVTISETNSASGHPHIQIWVSGSKIVDFIDTTNSSPQIASGAMGLYDEDAVVYFANVMVTALS